MFKKSFVGLLIGALLILSVGIFPVFKIKQQAIRKDIKRRIKNSIPDEELHILTFRSPATDVEWVKEGKEFILGDRMYDVVRAEVKGDSTVFHCINDTEEAVLFAQLDDYVQKELQSNSHSSKKKTNSSKTVQIQLFCVDFEWFLSIEDPSEKSLFPNYQEAIANRFSDLIPRPPQI
ncbi:MAG: hypothetical protein WC044_11995 [Crocinitomicaceae bacterium]